MPAPSTRSRPQVEIKPVGTAFTGAGLSTGSAVASTGAPVQGAVTVTGLANGTQYHWRARTRDAAGQTSGWVSFGGNAETVARRRRRHGRADRLDRRRRAAAAWTQDAHREPRPQVHGHQERLQSDAARVRTPAPSRRPSRSPPPGPGRWPGPTARRPSPSATSTARATSRRSTRTRSRSTPRRPVVTAVSATPNPFLLGQTTTIRFRAADAAVGHVPDRDPDPRRRRPAGEEPHQDRAVSGRGRRDVGDLGRPQCRARAGAARDLQRSRSSSPTRPATPRPSAGPA